VPLLGGAEGEEKSAREGPRPAGTYGENRRQKTPATVRGRYVRQRQDGETLGPTPKADPSRSFGMTPRSSHRMGCWMQCCHGPSTARPALEDKRRKKLAASVGMTEGGRPEKADPSPRAEARGYHFNLRGASGFGMTTPGEAERWGGSGTFLDLNGFDRVPHLRRSGNLACDLYPALTDWANV
jgi:hypothetical protein